MLLAQKGKKKKKRISATKKWSDEYKIKGNPFFLGFVYLFNISTEILSVSVKLI